MVNHEEFSSVLAEFARTLLTDFSIQSILDHLVDRIVDVLPVTAAGVTLIALDRHPHYIAASDQAALAYEQMQSEVGEGPCLVAYESRAAIAIPDLVADSSLPIFGPCAVDAGLRAVFAFPLRHDDGCLGALDLYRDTPGALDDEDLEAAQTLADVATAYLLNVRAREDARATGARHRHSALHDPLTSLPNRLLLQERIEQAAQRAVRSPATVAVLFADLDRFKTVNDTYGHRAGDELLVAVAHRLSSLVRSGDTLARVSGDEFVFLCEDLTAPSDAEWLAERVNAVFADPFVIAGAACPITLTASVGIAYAGPGSAISDHLVVEADMAMYQVKRRGGSGHQIIDMRAALQTTDLNQIETDLRAALVGGGLGIHYQPIVRTTDGRVAGVEALLRWNHPERGAIAPPTIFQLPEQSDLIAEVGAWVLERACLDHVSWLAADPRLELVLAVNMSARQLLDPDFAARVSEILDRTGMDPRSLLLEVTESIFIEDDGSAGEVLAALATRGIRLALDDFGTGHSSLSYLCRLPIHVVKIDRSFISDLDHTETRAIVAAITGLAHQLGLGIVAEGIETPAQADQVRSLGCELSQGFLFARPMPATAMAGYLAAARHAGLTVTARRGATGRPCPAPDRSRSRSAASR